MTIVAHAALSVKLKNRLQVTQNKMIRFILKLEPRSHVGHDQFERLDVVSVKDRVKQLNLNHDSIKKGRQKPFIISDSCLTPSYSQNHIICAIQLCFNV